MPPIYPSRSLGIGKGKEGGQGKAITSSDETMKSISSKFRLALKLDIGKERQPLRTTTNTAISMKTDNAHHFKRSKGIRASLSLHPTTAAPSSNHLLKAPQQSALEGFPYAHTNNPWDTSIRIRV